MIDQVISFTAPDANILIVDDVEINLDITSCLLEPLKMNVDTALSGMQAIELVKEKQYDLIFMDHMMPEMDGIETERRIKEISDVPVVALTANDDPQIKEQFLKLGFCDFMTKPVEASALEEIIRRWLPQEKIVTGTEKREFKEALDWSIDIAGIDTETAKKYAQSMDMYRQSLLTYVRNLPSIYEKIEAYRNADDIENYTITVHGLKSASKVIGALEISERAKELEAFGHNGENDKAYGGADELISMLEEMSCNIKNKLGIDDDKKYLSDEELKVSLEKLKEISEHFDLGGLMSWENEYASCRVSDDREDAFKEILASVRDVAYTEIAERIDKIMHIS